MFEPRLLERVSMARPIYLAAAVLFFCTSVAFGKGRSVAASELFDGPLLNITAPNSNGWKLSETSTGDMIFERFGDVTNETLVASVTRIDIPDFRKQEDFLAFIKQGVERNTSRDRFKDIEESFEYSEQRGYPCVSYKASSLDTKAQVSLFKHKSLVFQMRALYCQLPNLDHGGFSANFSHRGPAALSDIDSQAQAFFDGVQVPTKEESEEAQKELDAMDHGKNHKR
ncbi:MAG TPA: hypothetical protein VMI92_09815 [Steroidobacteraceae bacterium]|nr:hypothetical protein [Steroidobacteraceae bacterium]